VIADVKYIVMKLSKIKTSSKKKTLKSNYIIWCRVQTFWQIDVIEVLVNAMHSGR